RRLAMHENWPALGSLLYERGRAFRTLGELTRSPAEMDSARRYLIESSDYRGPNRPWVFAQTHEELALLALGSARLVPASAARGPFLARARAEIDTALRVPATAELPPAAAAALRSLDGEILVELARARHAPALLDSARARLDESSHAFAATTLPRHASLAWL